MIYRILGALALVAVAGLAVAQQTAPNAVNGGIYNSTPPALTNRQTAPFQMDSAGNLKVTGSGSSGVTPVGCSVLTPPGAYTTGSQAPIGCGPNGGVYSADGYTITGSATTTGAYSNMPIDTLGYSGVTVQWTSIGNAANRALIETTNDPTFTSWQAVRYNSAGVVTTLSEAEAQIAPSLTILYQSPAMGRWVRLRSTVQSGGTDTAVVVLRVSNSGPVVAEQGTGNVAANWSSIAKGSSSTSVGITPVVSPSAESSRVLKAGAGNLYSLVVTTGGTAGYVLLFNATSPPADGPGQTPIECLVVAASSSVSLNFNPGPPSVYSTGITAVFSTTGCFNKTASATAFFSGKVQ